MTTNGAILNMTLEAPDDGKSRAVVVSDRNDRGGSALRRAGSRDKQDGSTDDRRAAGGHEHRGGRGVGPRIVNQLLAQPGGRIALTDQLVTAQQLRLMELRASIRTEQEPDSHRRDPGRAQADRSICASLGRVCDRLDGHRSGGARGFAASDGAAAELRRGIASVSVWPGASVTTLVNAANPGAEATISCRPGSTYTALPSALASSAEPSRVTLNPAGGSAGAEIASRASRGSSASACACAKSRRSTSPVLPASPIDSR
jgi:hypothetical protein